MPTNSTRLVSNPVAFTMGVDRLNTKTTDTMEHSTIPNDDNTKIRMTQGLSYSRCLTGMATHAFCNGPGVHPVPQARQLQGSVSFTTSVQGHGLHSQQQVSLRLRKSPCLHGKEQTDVFCSGVLLLFQSSLSSLSKIINLVYVYQLIEKFVLS